MYSLTGLFVILPTLLTTLPDLNYLRSSLPAYFMKLPYCKYITSHLIAPSYTSATLTNCPFIHPSTHLSAPISEWSYAQVRGLEGQFICAFDKDSNRIVVRVYCRVLYCTALHCTALHCTVLYCTVLYCTVLYCTVLYCTVLYCTVLHCTVLYCTVLNCTVLYRTVLYCTVL